MANYAPGFQGYSVGRVSSLDKRTIGTFTDQNHISSLARSNNPQWYDKQIISVFTQSSLASSDFLRMLEAAEPFYLDGTSDSFQYGITKPFQFSKIIDIPDSTASQAFIGVDGKEFELVIDQQLAPTTIISIGHRWYGQQFHITSEKPVQYNGAWLHSAQLVSDTPSISYVNKTYFQPGVEIEIIHNAIGEFDQRLAGLDKMADKLLMYETLGAGYGVEHSITAWADDWRYPDTSQKDAYGRPLDIIYYRPVRNGKPVPMREAKWEPFIERLMREQMLRFRTNRMFFAKPAQNLRSFGDVQEAKKVSAGILDRLRRSGNYVPYYRGQFGPGLVRTVFGDLFYRRVSMGQREVVLYTNESGMDAFQQAIKEDAIAQNLVFNVGDNNKFVSGTGQNLELNFAFSSFITRETGRVRVVHLTELDLPQTNLEFGQNRKSTPIFIVFDVTSGGSMRGNIRPVRYKDQPNIMWSYVDGRRHHLGAYASQGHSAANSFPGYKIQMEAREDIFIEDLSRAVLIEELPFM